MKRSISCALSIAVLAASQLAAAPILYEGTLSGLGAVGTGTVVASGNRSCGLCGHGIGEETLDFWKVSITVPVLVTIRGTRLDSNLDLAFVLFGGVPFDVTPREMSLRDGKRIWQDGTPLDLTVMLTDLFLPGVGDDEIDRSPFPYGDPELNFFLDAGDYTLAISGGTGSGIVSAASANYRIELIDPTGASIAGPSAKIANSAIISETPEPSSYLLFGTGLVSILAFARRRRC